MLINTKRDTLIIDCNYACYRAMLKLLGLTYDNHPTGVIFGFLDQIRTYHTKFNNPRFIFAWDSENSFRRNVCPDYKKKDKKDDPEMDNLLHIGKPQFSEIRKNILPRIGFKNNFVQAGIEADDIIAQIIKQHWETTYRIVIVSGDNDLYQLLQPGVVIYQPITKTLYTEDDFIKEKKITPNFWPWVKAVGGCKSDNVKGIKGIAEGYAIKYLQETAPKSIREKIDQFDPLFNLSLVKLPHKKTRSVELTKDDFSIKEFENVCMDYGFHSFLSKQNYNKWKEILRND